MESQEAWKKHSTDLNRDWSDFQNTEITRMNRFRSEELSGPTVGNGIVFYPFSGPDALIVTVFFPASPTYVMVGLEPPGTLPTVAQIRAKDLKTYLEKVRTTVYSGLHRSFFITREMDRHFRGQVSDGLLPAILHLLVRTNHTITGYRYVRLEPDGRVVDRVLGEKVPRHTSGVEVDFKTDTDSTQHRVFYFSVNLSDSRLKENQAFQNFLSKLDGMTTYLKATSYMPHHKDFSILRDQILGNSAAILQDDSGIPYHYLESPKWNVQLYGTYERPFGSFRWLEQEDLRIAYATFHPKPLQFRIGYGFGRVPSNLQLATRSDLRAGLPGQKR